MAAKRFVRDDVPEPFGPVPEVVAVIHDHLEPAISRLEVAARCGDLDAIHAYALELSMGAACVASACAHSRRWDR